MPRCDCYLHRRIRRDRIIVLGLIAGMVIAFAYSLLTNGF